MNKFDLVVTRHPSLVNFLIDQGLVNKDVTVISHVSSPEQIRGRDVIGVLPHSLSSITKRFGEIPLNLPPEKRGIELNLAEIRQYAGELVVYEVRKIS